MNKEIIVIGGGASGLAAAIAAKEEGRDILLIEKESKLGGILNQCIHNGFGLEVFKEEYTGPEYANKYVQKFHESKIDFLLDTTVLHIDKIENGFEIILSSKVTGMKKVTCQSIIMSTGCYERTRGSISIPGDRPYGVITAGSAQRYLNIDGYMIGKKVFILGSGDIGLIMARRMYLEGAEVLGVAELMPYSNGLTRNIVQCLNDYNIPLYLSHTVTEIHGNDDNRLESIVIQEVNQSYQPIPGTEREFSVDTLLLSIGLVPDITLMDNLDVEHDLKTKSVKVNQAYETSVPGLFICGNSLQVHDLVDNVSMESERAGKCASEFVLAKKIESNESIKIKAGNNLLFVTPHYVDFAWASRETVIQFRSTSKIEKALLTVSQGDKELLSKRKSFIVPAEMETFTLDMNQIEKGSDILVNLEVL
ncbi:MAG: FAD-dependent oxidoreductase [Tenericutes bacterium]|nr:FAD-dependent oxidoreductase [Mycoplasmatota bacterium]